jgi:HEAT repeat protein
MNYSVNASNKVAELYGKDGLLHVLRNGQQKARYKAARWLGRFRGEDVEEELLKIVVEESDPFLRIQALYSLGRVGTTRALDALADTAEDSDESIARNARDAITAIRLRSEK